MKEQRILRARVMVLRAGALLVFGLQRSQKPISAYTYMGTYEGHYSFLSDCSSNRYNANTAATGMGRYLIALSPLDENKLARTLVPLSNLHTRVYT